MAKHPYLNAGHVHLVGHAAITVASLCLLPAVFNRSGRACAIYATVLLVGGALSTKDFVGMGRYALAAFPYFAVAGEAQPGGPASGGSGWRPAAAS